MGVSGVRPSDSGADSGQVDVGQNETLPGAIEPKSLVTLDAWFSESWQSDCTDALLPLLSLTYRFASSSPRLPPTPQEVGVEPGPTRIT